MPDDPRKKDNQNRKTSVAGEQDYEVQHFAEANGLSINQALDLIEKFGNDRETLDREAKKLA